MSPVYTPWGLGRDIPVAHGLCEYTPRVAADRMAPNLKNRGQQS